MHDTPVKTFIDWAAAGTIIASLAGWLPSIAAGFAIAWYCILIYDRFLGNAKK